MNNRPKILQLDALCKIPKKGNEQIELSEPIERSHLQNVQRIVIDAFSIA